MPKKPPPPAKELHVLNLGAGVQSTTLYLMFAAGELPVRIDAAIFADTGEEPVAVYKHLAWLQGLGGPPILVRSAGSRLGDDLMTGRNSTGQRFAAIPAYTMLAGSGANAREDLTPDESLQLELLEFRAGLGEAVGDEIEELVEGRTRRQCSKEYKVEVIEKTIRRELCGLEPGQRVPASKFPHSPVRRDKPRRVGTLRTAQAAAHGRQDARAAHRTPHDARGLPRMAARAGPSPARGSSLGLRLLSLSRRSGMGRRAQGARGLGSRRRGRRGPESRGERRQSRHGCADVRSPAMRAPRAGRATAEPQGRGPTGARLLAR